MSSSRRSDTSEVRAPLWLAHHAPGELDRCVHVGGLAVCRRCVVLYPAVVAWWTAWLLLAPPATWLLLAAWLLPVPMLVDWVLEHLRRTAPSPTRLVAVSLVAAPGLAAMLAVHTSSTLDPAALLPAGLYGTVAVGAAWYGARTFGGTDWHHQHLADEADRSRRLRALLDIEGDTPPDGDRVQSLN